MTTRRRILTVVAVLAALVLAGGVATAHPLGNFTINRASEIVLSPGRIEIHYVLDMAEIPTFQEQPSVDTDGDGNITPAERQVWADHEASRILAGLTLSVGGASVSLVTEGVAMRFRTGQGGLPILYFTATFAGALPVSSGSVRYDDAGFPGRIGWKEVTARSRDGVAVIDSSVPATSVSRELTAYPKDLLSSPLDVTSASFGFGPGPATISSPSAPVDESVTGAPVASGGSFAGLIRWRLTPLVLLLSLSLAMAFGAIHALGPGHGKTITAAYLVGSGARAGQALAVGVAVALMHTASVLVLGLVVFVLARSFPADHVYPWLTLITGVVALGLGTGLFITRLRARRRGVEPWHGHDHPLPPTLHSHEHHAQHDHTRHEGGVVAVLERTELDLDSLDPPPAIDPGTPHGRPLSARGLAALAVAGGILPSPTAFVVLTAAISAHRVGYGLALLFAFSAGLAAALMGVGLAALRVRSVVAARLGRRSAGLISLASALVIVGFGLFFASRGLVQVV